MDFFDAIIGLCMCFFLPPLFFSEVYSDFKSFTKKETSAEKYCKLVFSGPRIVGVCGSPGLGPWLSAVCSCRSWSKLRVKIFFLNLKNLLPRK